MMKFMICLLWLAQPLWASAQVNLQSKKKWLVQIESCTSSCDLLSKKILKDYAKIERSARFIENPGAELTVLYLHSYTQQPHEIGDFYSEYGYSKKFNYVAPVFSAHHSASTPQDYLYLNPEELILDSELFLKLSAALGKPVVIHGFSMGGMLAIGLVLKYPNLVSRLALMAPALMIRDQANNLVCLGQFGFVQSVAKTFAKAHDPVYLEKYLNGACALSSLINLIRDRVPFNDNYNAYSDFNPRAEREARLEQIQNLAKEIQVPTYLAYSVKDDVLDVGALQAFGKNLRHGKVFEYAPNDQSYGHMSVLFDLRPSTGDLSHYRAMSDFIFQGK